MSELRIGALEFAADPLGMKNKARGGETVVITNRGRPDVAMVSYERWQALEAALPLSVLEALGRHPASAVEFEPPCTEDHAKGAEFWRCACCSIPNWCPSCARVGAAMKRWPRGSRESTFAACL